MLGRVGEEQEPAREVGLVHLPRELGVGAAPHEVERWVRAQRVGERAAGGGGARFVGRGDREDHRARELRVAKHLREQRLFAAAGLRQEVRDVGAEAEPRRDEGRHRREQHGEA